jgi:hypothetical protein
MNSEDYEMVIDNLRQIIEALGCENRYYFFQHYKREAYADEELMIFYIQQGGAVNYRKRRQL